MPRFQRSAALLKSPLALFAFAAVLLPSLVAAQSVRRSLPPAVALTDGVLIDSSRQVAYVTNAERRIDAIELVAGNRLWTTSAAAKPLAIADGRLVAQAESAGPGRLEVVAFRTVDGAPADLAVSVDLPDDLHATLGDLPGRSFRVSASSQGSALTLSWSASSANAAGTAQGYLPSDEEGTVPSGGFTQSSQQIGRSPSLQRSGAATLDLDTGRVSSGQATALAASQVRVAPNHRAIDGTGRLVHASADGGHVLRVERQAQAGPWNAFRWTVYARGSDEALGSLSHHSATAPFVVRGDQLIFVTEPSVRVEDGKTIATPMQVQSMNLKTGQSNWTAEVNDPDYTGPIAP